MGGEGARRPHRGPEGERVAVQDGRSGPEGAAETPVWGKRRTAPGPGNRCASPQHTRPAETSLPQGAFIFYFYFLIFFSFNHTVHWLEKAEFL